jgi:hypothetical protein
MASNVGYASYRMIETGHSRCESERRLTGIDDEWRIEALEPALTQCSDSCDQHQGVDVWADKEEDDQIAVQRSLPITIQAYPYSLQHGRTPRPLP